VRFSVALPVDRHEDGDALVTGDAVASLAAAAEELRYDAVFVTDHPAADVRWLEGGGHHALEPTVALAFAAAATTRLRLHTHVYVLAYRNPFLAAKSVATLDRLSGGRLILGVAAGYLKAEFAALGVPFDERNDRLDDALGVARRLWRGEQVAGEGPGWSARGVLHLPPPATPGGPPVWIGGNSGAAMRRAARLGDGWSPFPTQPTLSRTAKTADISNLDLLAERTARFRSMWEAEGRAGEPDICFGAFSLGRYQRGEASAEELVDELGRMEALGVTWCSVGVGGRDVAEVVDGMRRFAAEIAVPLSPA